MSTSQNSMANITVELLADNPHLVPAIAEIRWREWGDPQLPDDLNQWIDITLRESGRDRIPVTWVAKDDLGRGLGSIALDEFDLAERRDRSPWVVGVIVEAQHRGLGIGGQLMRTLEIWARQYGYSQAWVATGGRAVDFYQKCGWEVIETIPIASGEIATVLTKSF